MQEIDHYNTLIWDGTIKYGPYSADQWVSVGGIKHPAFQNYLNKVLERIDLFEGFNLYLTGGLLEDWQSWDIDWVLTGPYQPQRIKSAMEWITIKGFEANLYPDVHYSKEIFSLYDWQNTGKTYSDWLYELSNVFIKEGVQTDMSFCEPVDGMFRRWNTYPFKKNINKHEEGYRYKKPIQVI